nr:MAG TPA: hypothetical protein [Caudoviricetes sp.]
MKKLTGCFVRQLLNHDIVFLYRTVAFDVNCN